MTQSLELLNTKEQESQQKKLHDLTSESSLYRQQLKNQQYLSQSSFFLYSLVIGLSGMKYCALALNFLLNILILCFYDDDHNEIKELDQSKRIAFYFFGSLECLLSVLIIISHFFKNLPAFTRLKIPKRKLLSYRLTVTCSLIFWIGYAGISIYSMINWLYHSLLLLYTFLCCSLLWKVFIALFNHLWEIIQIVLGIIVVTYIYSIFGYKYLKSSFEYEGCSTVYSCFTTVFNKKLRSFGGIGDMLRDNVTGNEDYWGRYWYDLTAFVVINCLLFCIIWVIVMDIIRQVHKRKKFDVCYICGKSRADMGRDLEHHILHVHSVRNYICYLMYLEDKSFNELDPIESYVRNLQQENMVDYFPSSNNSK